MINMTSSSPVSVELKEEYILPEVTSNVASQVIKEEPTDYFDLQFFVEEGNTSEEYISPDEFSDDEYLPDSSDLSSDEEDNEQESEEEDSMSVLTPSEWSETPITFKVLPFQEVTGLTVDTSQLQTAYSYFRLLFTDEFISLILDETNKNAQQKFFPNWKCVERNELLIFLALFFHMGIVNFPTLKHYWRTDMLFKMRFFSKFMNRDRFLLILSCLHFADKNTTDKSHKLWKCKPILDYFNNKMHVLNVPQQELLIDASMMLFRGRIPFRQYIKSKRHKYGIRSYMLCQSNGLVQKILLYMGKGTRTGEAGHAAAVVKDLLEDYVNKGYCLYMDRFHNSYALSQDLLSKETHTTGPLAKTRKGNSQDVVKRKLKKGESICRYKDGVLQLKWRDTRDVLMQSTLHSPEMIESKSKKGECKNKPRTVLEYNSFMSGIDKLDHMVSYYEILRMNMKWYRKVVLRIFHMMFINAYILHRSSLPNQGQSYPLLKFHEDIVKSLINESMELLTPQYEEQPRIGHFPDLLPPRPNGAKGRRKCRVCVKSKKRTETIYCCSGCYNKPPLCVLCFKYYKHE